ncbi:MAG: SH3 domain-containing protein [Anaerolineae bacterium]|nr:SH3 domain-containing protein [Anaerolineae bacterium]
MTFSIRLRARPEPDGRSVRFHAEFAAPGDVGPALCAPAWLDTGDGHTLDLGLLCAPTAVTWREQRSQELGIHRYISPGPHTAHLHWGEVTVSTTTEEGAPSEAPAAKHPELPLFALRHLEQPLQVALRLQVSGLAPEQRLRIDGGAGQVLWLKGADGPEQSTEWPLAYAKPGRYAVAVDLLDSEGFWLATLAESPLEVTFAAVEPMLSQKPAADIPEAVFAAPPEVSQAVPDDQPWLPFRYVRPMWSGVSCYTTPGGGQVSRVLSTGTYLAIKAETIVGGALWYQTSGRDWVAASAVAIQRPSELRGVVLGQAPQPPPEPPPEPEPIGRGVVTASLLNVRARPGVSSDNPPVDRLPNGTQVDIFEEATVAGAVWYRIGPNRWVHSGWVRRIEAPPPQPEPEPEPQPEPEPIGRGVVTASLLNVRARPGVSSDNPPVDQLPNGTQVDIFEEATVAGAIWYRIGPNRWVHSGWVRLLEGTTHSLARGVMLAAAGEPISLPVGWVISSSLNVRARPGTAPDNPPVDEVTHNQMLRILETRQVGGADWHRIGPDRWVHGGSVAVASAKPRPSSIGPTERWVAVCLKEQTAVAYEGDRPVYATMVASGLPGTPTVQGVFRTWLRLLSGRMAGPGYYLEEVTWTCYFYDGYALHTAYWHDAFGSPRSHGCVNLSPYDAWWIFRWSEPGGPNSPAVYVYWA